MHLSKGSPQPPKVGNTLRLYSSRFCPFAQRVRLVLHAKNIEFELVNVHVYNKPEWIFDINPLGQVPVLDTGSRIITQSLDISDYLDEAYADPPLYPGNKEEKERDKTLMKDFERVLKCFYGILEHPIGEKTFDDHMKVTLPLVAEYEAELKMRGTTFFGGNAPHMLDYMMWPFAERASLCGSAFDKKIPDATVFPCLYSWCAAMRKQIPVQQAQCNLERQDELYRTYRTGDYNVDFDI